MLVIAIVGKKNVGKSVLFNKLTNTKDSIVTSIPGFTNDQKYGVINYNNKKYIVIDTFHIDHKNKEKEIFSLIRKVNLVLYICDIQFSINDKEKKLIKEIERICTSTVVVINKIDTIRDTQSYLNNFSFLSRNKIFLISAINNVGIKDILKYLSSLNSLIRLNQIENITINFSKETTKIVVIGRPNVGKSTFINYILGIKRLTVSEQRGTTRDSISIPLIRKNKKYIITDTAGLIKRKKIKNKTELQITQKVIYLIKDSTISLIMLNLEEGIVKQDLYIINLALKYSNAILIAINKCDKNEFVNNKNAILTRLKFIKYKSIYFISSLLGSGIDLLFKEIDIISKNKKILTSQINKILIHLKKEINFKYHKGQKIRLKYAILKQRNPITILIYGKNLNKIPINYTRFLKKEFKKKLQLESNILRLEFKNYK